MGDNCTMIVCVCLCGSGDVCSLYTKWCTSTSDHALRAKILSVDLVGRECVGYVSLTGDRASCGSCRQRVCGVCVSDR